MKSSIELYGDLSPFLRDVSSEFDVVLTGGVYLRFSNSGRRGETKWFNLGLAEILTTLRDIKMHHDDFAGASRWEEKIWRDLGPRYFSDDAAKSFVTVQTKPIFTILAKIIHWANGHKTSEYHEGLIDLSPDALDKAIEVIGRMVLELAPDSIASQVKVVPERRLAEGVDVELTKLREKFADAVASSKFISAG